MRTESVGTLYALPYGEFGYVYYSATRQQDRSSGELRAGYVLGTVEVEVTVTGARRGVSGRQEEAMTEEELAPLLIEVLEAMDEV
jgi:hypothetical protein